MTTTFLRTPIRNGALRTNRFRKDRPRSLGRQCRRFFFRKDGLLDLVSNNGRLDYLGIGFESLSRESLETIGNPKKARLRETYSDIVEKLKKKGIGVFGYFMFGFENSRPKDLPEIVRFVTDHGINAQISLLTPMPGTALYERLLVEHEGKFGKITKGPLGKWHLIRNHLLEKTGMSQTEIIRMLAEAYAEIYDDARRSGKAFCRRHIFKKRPCG